MPRLVFALVLVHAGLVFADVPPADTSDCSSKKAGAACQTDGKKSGACQAKTCSKLDYSQGTPPKSVEYECVTCVEGGKPAGGCAAVPVTAMLALAPVLALLRRRR